MSVPALRPAALFGLLSLGLLAAPAVAAPAYDTKAQSAIIIDMSADRVLFEKDADRQIPTASMSKLMSMYVVFEKLRAGTLKPEDELTVSKHAWSKEGSRMFVEVNSKVKVSDLIKGVIVQSGNDAITVLAEGIAGTEDNFANMLNEAAARLGMQHSHFMNATGLPADGHYSTVRDLAILAEAIIRDFPEYYEVYGETEFTYNNIRQENRNPLLGTEGHNAAKVEGADGLKTGHTEEAGFGLIGSAKRGGRRLVEVMSGMKSMQERADESSKMMEWGFREFSAYTLFQANDRATDVAVWMGDKPSVPLRVAKDVVLTLSPEEAKQIVVKARVTAPVPAPVQAGAELGQLVVDIPGSAREMTVPLVAANSVGELGVVARFLAGIQATLFGGTGAAPAATTATVQK